MYIESKIKELDNKINSAKELDTFISTVGGVLNVLALTFMLLYGFLEDKSLSNIMSLVTFMIAVINLIGFLFCYYIAKRCDDKIGIWMEQKNRLITRLDSANVKMDIAYAFANCYWRNEDKHIVEMDFDRK